MAASAFQEWAVIRLAVVQTRGCKGRLLFATVTELARGRPAPAKMVGVEACSLANSDDRVFFRRTVLSKEDAVAWYTSLGEGERCTPVPTHPDHREGSDGVPFLVPRLQDDQPWPALGLPITEELFSRPGQQALDAAPFIGSVPGRVHRRFGHHEGLDAFLRDNAAQAFVARRMHVNLSEYQEYLGSAAYIAPDPIIRQIDNFMAPAKDDRGERIIYRFVPRPGQNLEHLRLTTFDKEARLLTSFDTHHVPADGILEVAKGTCSGQYGYVVTHEQQGILAYQPFVGFIRQMNFSVQVAPRKSVRVRVPTTSAKDAPPMEYQAAVEQEEASRSILGEVTSPDPGARVAAEARRRERIALAKQYGQRWFHDNSREEAADFVRGLLRAARFRVVLVDPYLGALQLGQFLYVIYGSEVNVTLLTTALAFEATATESKMHQLQIFSKHLADLKDIQRLEPEVRVVPASKLHDRFMVVDDEVWFVGNSLNSLGVKASMIVRLPNPGEVIDRLEVLRLDAPSLANYIDVVGRSASGQSPE
ncbi:hypothetical protein CRM82_03545 [Comamonas terrigena]|uniref:PLD phosphodiesterase domain-containing protein n=1 Tax=Comamonas terrigena TaxID=32013 RepID=A0A2A7UR65_COMTR|nr:VPA1262 family N-terminal domain-containing protein [Comamonas terrigena]PEH87805.1 hypothetical protein CRM82_03545 [Comamonas terrigena]BBL22684.1 hypothetical protein CT3_01390 [Comamonas terrigena NBRC 13299]SUY92360.1 Uncharacterised protein [Comamonas terrigena]